MVAFYGDFQALFGVTFEVRPNEVLALIGGNGAGKTTCLRVISGLLRPRSGTVHFEGKDITRTAPDTIVDLGIAHVPEGRQLFPEMTVEENLYLGSQLPRARAQRAANLERMYALFPRLAERRKQLAGTLSGGEQQMVAISRALMSEPKLLMLDEPSLGLSPKLTEQTLAAVREIAKSRHGADRRAEGDGGAGDLRPRLRHRARAAGEGRRGGPAHLRPEHPRGVPGAVKSFPAPVSCRAVALLVVLAACSSQPSRMDDSRRPPPATLPDAGTATARSSGPSAVEDASSGCRSDADCGPGTVCGRCGQGPGECIGGCSTSADCPSGTTCVQVQCIRCPCPAQCMKR